MTDTRTLGERAVVELIEWKRTSSGRNALAAAIAAVVDAANHTGPLKCSCNRCAAIDRLRTLLDGDVK